MRLSPAEKELGTTVHCRLIGLCLVVLACGCEQRKPAALDVPTPRADQRTQPPDPPPVERPKPRLSLNGQRIENFIVRAHQIGYLQPGKIASFELELFDQKTWPVSPVAWVGRETTDKRWRRPSRNDTGRVRLFKIPVPSPIPADSRLWVMFPDEDATEDAPAASASFKLRRE